MSEAPVTVQKPTEYIEKLETAKLDTPANVTALRCDFQVKIILFLQVIFV